MRVFAKLGLTAIALMIGASTAHAQSKLVELGADARLGFGLDTPKSTSIDIPTGRFRAAWYLQGDKIAIEPSAQLNYVSTDAGSNTYFAADVGLLYHTSTIRTQSQLYFRPFIGMQSMTDLGGQLGLGVGVGMKWPMIANRLSMRGEAQLGHYFDTSKLGAQTNLNFLFGLSFFTR